MKTLQSFVAAFVVGATLTVAVRVSGGLAPAEPLPAVASSAAPLSASSSPAVPLSASSAPSSRPAWTGPVTDLENHMDPTTGEHITQAVTSVYLGYRVRLASEASKKTFEAWPIRFLMKLDLEVVGFDAKGKQPSRVEQVDASAYGVIAPDNCLFMGGAVDVSRQSYILHRGFKIHFC